MTRRSRAWNAVPSFLLLVACGGGVSGCVAAGLASGPVMVAIQMVADRSVERTYPADLGTTWVATTDALARMQVRIGTTDRTGDRWTVAGTGENISVTAQLSRATSGMTKVSVRVEAGKLTADRQTAQELLNQVGVSVSALTPSGLPSQGRDAASESLGALQAEIRRLRSDIETSRERTQSAPVPPTGSKTADPGTGIVSIPPSYGLATVAGSDRGAMSPQSATPVDARSASTPTLPAPPGQESDVVAPTLSPVGALVPVSAVDGSGAPSRE
jgi:HAMP domain-containing protein